MSHNALNDLKNVHLDQLINSSNIFTTSLIGQNLII